ncbi:putative heme iron utilization protein [Rivularia sp. PCC 7116]|uniref:HugZ family pyridoxamine 5'-phosphate oxidase n=1 Tax=Rivularia sp. PCC 7116 TaxID=373994 RepID=UPI00029F3924|nr:pyridoxamine 5'-phosphate oxidase family protein [Rivularia sp. PCC 7116]AFY57262.1 putative heme iron utilization protein [Rivularia sp. PCC 7116]
MNIARAKAAYALLINTVRTVVLGTVSADNMPNVSYAPFVIDEAKNIYVFVSKLSIHAYNLQANPIASLMLIEDENKSKQIFARRRLTYSCKATTVDRNSTEWDCIVNKFEKRFGNIVYIIHNLPDINIIKFTPYEGLFIMNFGSIYKIKSDDLERLIYIEDVNNDSAS